MKAISVAMSLPAGLLVADIVSAVAHWLGDTYFACDTPVVGAIVGPFRLHHRDPEAFRRHAFLERNRNNLLAALPLVLLAAWLTTRVGAAGHVFAVGTLLVAALALASATQIHAWAHDLDPPTVIGWLQRAGILLSRERHAHHHRGAHDGSYGIVNGWANVVLDHTRFFRRAERLAARVGLRPAPVEPTPGTTS